MDTADVMEVLINRPYAWVRIKAPAGALPTIASELNRTPGFEVSRFGTDVLARWTPTDDTVPSLADIPEAPRGYVAPTKEELEDALLVRAKELAPPLPFSEVKPYDPNEPARPEAFRPKISKPFFTSRPNFEPTEAQLRARAAFTARRKAAGEARQERLRLKGQKP
jgi:hypothetical protein